jgi:hypothetical protein
VISNSYHIDYQQCLIITVHYRPEKIALRTVSPHGVVIGKTELVFSWYSTDRALFLRKTIIYLPVSLFPLHSQFKSSYFAGQAHFFCIISRKGYFLFYTAMATSDPSSGHSIIAVGEKIPGNS